MVEIRPARPGEESQQKALWRAVFGDSAEAVDCFYRTCCRPEDVPAAVEDGRIVSMLALMPMTLESPGREAARAWYVYALATEPAYRGRGIARALLRFTDRYLAERGADALTVVPAEPSLHQFFGSAGFQPCFAVRELRMERLLPPAAPAGLESVTPERYNAIRNARLTALGLDWVRYDDASVRYQQGLSRLSGADLYAVMAGGETGCAAVERTADGGVLCKELLISACNVRAAAAQIGARCGSAGLRVRGPADPKGPPDPAVRPFGMVKWYAPAGSWANTVRGYLGLGFD